MTLWNDANRYTSKGVLPHGSSASAQDAVFWESVSVIELTLAKMRKRRAEIAAASSQEGKG